MALYLTPSYGSVMENDGNLRLHFSWSSSALLRQAATVALLFTISSQSNICSGDFSLLHTLNVPTITSGDIFGDPVSIDGDYVLIGSIGHDAPGVNIGQTHLFNAVSGTLLRTFNDPTPTGMDFFGRSVALDGNYALIGANGDDTNGSNVGQAHLFDVATGSLLRNFSRPVNSGGSGFGTSVAIDDGKILIAAPLGAGLDVGQVHLFDAATGDLIRTFNDPTPITGNGFGLSVAISGNAIVIGSPSGGIDGSGDVGQAHLFDAVSGDLLHTFDDPTPSDGDGFGVSVAINGGRVLIGALGDDTNGSNIGQAHLFDAATGNLLHTFNDPTPTAGDGFGESVAIDGDNVLIGAPDDRTNSDGDNNRFGIGQVHLFSATTGALLRTFDDPTVTSGDRFGDSVAIQGSRIVIGAPADDTNGPNAGQAHLFDLTVPEPGSICLLFGMALITATRGWRRGR